MAGQHICCPALLVTNVSAVTWIIVNKDIQHNRHFYTCQLQRFLYMYKNNIIKKEVKENKKYLIKLI